MPNDPNYIGADIPLYESPADDVDCGEIEDRNFLSIGSDPHRLDRDKDGLACEEGGSQQPQDFSKDGKPDLFWRNKFNGVNVVWPIDGFEAVGSLVHSEISDTNWAAPAIADFNQDGNPDLLLRHQQLGLNVIRQFGADGTTVLRDIALPEISDLNWQFVGSADFDQDGNVDLLLRHQGVGENLVWTMDKTTVTGGRALASIPDLNWQVVAVADFNQDGNPDLLLRHQQVGINLIRTMDGFEILEDIRLPDVSDANWRVEGARDFNDDGSPDIVWRNAVTGDSLIWQMDGTQRVRDWSLGQVDNSWELTV